MKKPICALLILVICFAVCACDKTAPEGVNDPQTDGAPATASDLSAPDSSAPDADAGGSDSSAPTDGTFAPTDGGDGEFVPTEDNVIWGKAGEEGALFDGDGSTSILSIGAVKKGEIYIADALGERMESADSGDRLAVILMSDHPVYKLFSCLPDGYEDRYTVKIIDWVSVCFMTAEEIGQLEADAESKAGLTGVSFECYRKMTEHVWASPVPIKETEE